MSEGSCVAAAHVRPSARKCCSVSQHLCTAPANAAATGDDYAVVYVRAQVSACVCVCASNQLKLNSKLPVLFSFFLFQEQQQTAVHLSASLYHTLLPSSLPLFFLNPQRKAPPPVCHSWRQLAHVYIVSPRYGCLHKLTMRLWAKPTRQSGTILLQKIYIFISIMFSARV